MIVEYIRYRLADDERPAFVDAVGAVGAIFAADAGCLGWELAEAVDAEDSHVLRITWASTDANEAFQATDGFQGVVAALSPFAGAAGPVTLFRPVAGSG